MPKTIRIATGDDEFTVPTTKETLGDLVNNTDFIEDYNVPSGAQFEVNGSASRNSAELVDGDVVSWSVPTSSKA